MSDICSKIINEINNKNFNTALKLSGGYSENNDLHILNNLKGIIFINLKDYQKAKTKSCNRQGHSSRTINLFIDRKSVV